MKKPNMNVVGLSSYTPVKQYALRITLSSIFAYMEKFDDKVIVVDGTAGPGQYNGIDGSPVQIMESLREAKLEFSVFFIEKDRSNFNCLLTMLGRKYPNTLKQNTRLVLGDQKEKIPRILKTQRAIYGQVGLRGLVYLDPCGELDFTEIAELSQSKDFNKFDFLFNIPSKSSKRSSGRKNSSKFIMKQLENIHRKNWFISSPIGTYGWVRIYATNFGNKKLFNVLDGECDLKGANTEFGDYLFDYSFGGTPMKSSKMSLAGQKAWVTIRASRKKTKMVLTRLKKGTPATQIAKEVDVSTSFVYRIKKDYGGSHKFNKKPARVAARAPKRRVRRKQ